MMEQLLDQIAVQDRRLAEAYRLGSPTAPVPGLAWSARDVIAHTGAVHRWASDIVVRRLPRNETGGSQAFAWTGPDDELTGWFLHGLDHLLSTLHAADAELTCFTFIPGVPSREFWIRRQAHENAIHRVDVEAAAGLEVSDVEPWFAKDGLSEIVGSFAREPQFAAPRIGRLLLDATDGPSWRIDFSPDGNRSSPDTPAGVDADASVHGTSDQLYRWAWNRPVTHLALSGDPATLQTWRDTIRIL